MPHQWFSGGARASLVLPTTCVHSCSVSRVSCQSATGSAGHLVSRSAAMGPACQKRRTAMLLLRRQHGQRCAVTTNDSCVGAAADGAVGSGAGATRIRGRSPTRACPAAVCSAAATRRRRCDDV